MDKLLQEFYEIHTDYDKFLKAEACQDGNCDDYDHGCLQGWKEAMEMVITRLEKFNKEKNDISN